MLNVMLTLSLSIQFRENFPHDPEAINSGWNPTVDCRLEENLTDFLPGTVVIEGSPYVDPEFVGSVEGR